MSVTLEEIKKLREATGVSIQACKKALEEANGSFDEAVDGLRKKGAAKAAARSERETAEGRVFIKQEGGKVAMLKLLCETDFTSGNSEFIKEGENLVGKVFNGEDVKEAQELKDLGLKTGENIQVGDALLEEGVVAGTYIHSNFRIGTLVILEGGDEEKAKDVAMHVAATNPAHISPEDVEDNLVEKEKEIWKEQLINEGKPESILDNIMKGKERKFREENALLTQPFVKSPDQKIGEFLGEEVKVFKFFRFEV